MQQNEAFNLLKMGKNIFLTGAAGSGKTYLLNKYIQYLTDNHVEVAVTASTGIAATHLHGTTIHSWSGLGVKDAITQKDLEKLLATSRIKRNYKKTKVLIIDEISMLHKQQLDMVNTIARFMLKSDKAFAGIQIILCGDFFQLPPVMSHSSLEKQFAFEASVWNEANFHVCYLHEQHRQGDDLLLTVLNDIRSGHAGEHTKVHLRTRYKKEPHGATKATKLYSRNVNVDAINEAELENLPGRAKTFKMTAEGFIDTLLEGLKKSCLAPERLVLKIGAEVMFIKNDPSARYVNGSRGVVVDFDDDGWPIVKTYDNEMIVAYPEEWKVEDHNAVRAKITQVPLRLAWAITIHKSQGMTLDAVEIDLGDAFEPGMGYVALSRVRSLNGLKLMNLNEIALTVHPKILQHDKVFKESSVASVEYLQTLSAEEMTRCHNETLLARFEGGKPKEVGSKKVGARKREKKQSMPTHMVTLGLLKENLSVEAIAAKRELAASTILSHIEKLQRLNQVDIASITYLKEALPKTDFDAIFAELEKSDNRWLTPVYDIFAGRYSYAWIQLVRLFVGERD